MRNNSGVGCVGTVAIGLAFIVGALLVVALVRADVFKTQPSQAAVSAAYAARARIENEAIQAQAAADLAHAKEMQRIERDAVQTLKDVGVVLVGGSVLFAFAGMAAGSYRAIGSARMHTRIIKPNRRGQFPLYINPATGAMTNPNLMTTPELQPGLAQTLPPELQIEALAWVQRANIAASLSQTKTFATTATQERGLLRAAALPAAPAPGATPVPAYDTTGEFREVDDGTGIHMHDDPATTNPMMQAASPKPVAGKQVVNTPHGEMPSDIASEEEFNDFIKRRN